MNKLFTPFEKSNSKIITFIWIVLIGVFYESLRNPMLPSLKDIALRFPDTILSQDFFRNVVLSLKLAFFSCFIAIIVSLILAYSSLIPAFSPLANIVSIMRFLGYAGVTFVFTIILKESEKIKTGLLIFSIVPFFVTSAISLILSIDKQYLELCYTLRMNKWETLWEVVIFGKAEAIFEIFIQNVAISFMMLTSVESLTYEGGIGMELAKHARVNSLESIFSILFVTVILALIIVYTLNSIKAKYFPFVQSINKK